MNKNRMFIIKMTNEYNSTQSIQTSDPLQYKHCKQHQLAIQFLCSDRLCRENPLICAECLPNHRNHSWETLKNIYKEINQMRKQGFVNIEKIDSTEEQIKILVSKFKKKIDRKIIELQSRIYHKIQEIKQTCQELSHRSKNIEQQNPQSLLKILRRFRKKPQPNSIQNMRKFITDSIQAAQTKVITILSDIELSIDVDWLKTNQKSRRLSLQSLKTHINQPIQQESTKIKENIRQSIKQNIKQSTKCNVRFDKDLKHSGIHLTDDNTMAIFDNAKSPAAILNTNLSQQNKFTFQIVKLTHTAFFFPDTTICIGVCQPNIVKTADFKKINQRGKGAYLIGSTGWSYHHKNQQYDRKNIVGWRFTQKDKITIEISMQQPGYITFTKQGFLFDSQFKMILSLNSNELKCLQPCVCFESDPGAIIKLINIDSS